MSAVPKLTTGLWISSVLRRTQADGVMATVMIIGDHMYGAVLVVARARNGLSRLYTATMARDGSPAWIETTKTALSDNEVTERTHFLRKRDTDLWVLEIETDTPELYLDGQMV